MTFLPTDPGVMVVVVHSRSGWDGYDRGIRDHMNDARPGDPYGQTYRWHRALTLAWLYGLPGGRYNPTEDSHVEAQQRALATLAPFGQERCLADLNTSIAMRFPNYDREASL